MLLGGMMSAEVEFPIVGGDLALWYPTFEVYAASTTSDNGVLHGPHVAPPVSLDRVRAALDQLVATYGEGIREDSMLNLEVLRVELEKRRSTGGHGSGDEGSPWHNFWHWVHGG
jgi:hypothetical protein